VERFVDMATYAKAPCKDCSDRCVGCHSNCDKYKAFKEENERVKVLSRKNKEIETYERVRSANVKEAKRGKF